MKSAEYAMSKKANRRALYVSAVSLILISGCAHPAVDTTSGYKIGSRDVLLSDGTNTILRPPLRGGLIVIEDADGRSIAHYNPNTNSLAIGEHGMQGRIEIGGTTIAGGKGKPQYDAPSGSLYLRSDGTDGNREYVSSGHRVWRPVPGV